MTATTIEDKLNNLQMPGFGVGDCYVIGKQTLKDFITTETTKARLQEMELAHEAWLTTSLVDHMNKRLAQLTDMLATDSKPPVQPSDASSNALQKEQKQ